MKRLIIWIIAVIVLMRVGIIPDVVMARTALNFENSGIPFGQTPATDAETQQESSLRSYLFIHDTSKNMRGKNRIPIMQTSIRAVLENIPSLSQVGLRAFGHRFPVEGPDVCDDTDIVVPVRRLAVNREDFETQLNILLDPGIGGGAPVGLALKQGIADLQYLEGPKEVYLYLVDLLKCDDPNPLDVIKSACQVNDLHLTLVGIGLKSDLQTLHRHNIQRLGCVDVLNVTTSEEAEALPDKLMTRFLVEFRNAEGQLVDPIPGDELILQLFQKAQGDKQNRVQRKVKDQTVKGTSIETVGLDEGMYVMELAYEGQKLRTQQEIFVKARKETREILQLGKMSVEVTDSDGSPIDNPVARQLKITVIDAGNVVRTAAHVSNTAFDLLPGSQYKVLVSYIVGGKTQETEFQKTITIEEGNHQAISVPLPIGAISGKVFDMVGHPAQNVDLTLTETDPTDGSQKIEHKIATDENGDYFFPDLGVGSYALSFNKPGYKRETRSVSVVGGKINEVENVRLFHGIEVVVAGISGATVDDPEVVIVHTATSRQIPLTPYNNTYRNREFLPEGKYTISVHKEGYKSVSREISIQDLDPSIEVSFELPYYITVNGIIVDGKEEPISDAVVAFQNQNSVVAVSKDEQQMTPPSPRQGELINPDGSFQTRLLVTGVGDEGVRITWKDIYNQDYVKEVAFALPSAPQAINLGKVYLPINFLRLTINDVLGDGVIADNVTVLHKQTGQSGMQMTLLRNGIYESTALLDGEYTIRIVKKGYQDVERNMIISGGKVGEVPITLYNYVTVAGTVVNGKNDRISGASVRFQGLSSELTSSQPIITGKDGHFQTTLLVKKAEAEKIEITWSSPDSGRDYYFETETTLPGIPIAEFYPMNLGEYQIPANFLSVEVQNISRKGLSEVQVTFISDQGERIPGSELGGGFYESPDLQDGYYDIAIAKEGYKENIIIADVTVGENSRKVQGAPIILPHYITVTGTILNGKDEVIPNVDIIFGGKHSEQLEKCRTDQLGRFRTTLLVTDPGEESWQAVWKREEYRTSGAFPLPLYPGKAINIGEIRLPVNFVTLPVEDIRGNLLGGVTVEVTDENGIPVNLKEFILEEVEQGRYQAKNLPDGIYVFSLQKDGYEIGKSVNIGVAGGKHYVLEPIKLGSYVEITGTVFNGKQAPVANAMITFGELCSSLIPPAVDEEQGTKGEEAPPAPFKEIPDKSPGPAITTNTDGIFAARLLVKAPGTEQVVVSWGEEESVSYPLSLPETPGSQQITLHLPINFIRLDLTDISGKPLSGASITLTHQTEKIIFSAEEFEDGSYESQGIPDGTYIVSVGKEQYEPQTDTLTLQGGELQHVTYRLNHYVTVRGSIVNGRNEGVAAATVNFGNLKTVLNKKIISGIDGVFVVELLVRETGRESGEITWVGKHGTYTKQFWIDLPLQPASFFLPEEETRLPVNFVSLELKSVAATGVAGATVKFTHREDGQVIEARDIDNGNYEGEELPDGTYDISITKEKYKAITIEQVVVANGEYRTDIQVPKFLHYITVSGVVLNGKGIGVPKAVVAVKDPKRLQEWEPVSTREDGSFTLQALVTDVGSEILDVIWNDRYAITLPVTLPSIPRHIQLSKLTLPINFIAVNVQNIFGKNLSEASVAFLKKQQALGDEENLSLEQYSSFPGTEVSEGMYESPELPNGEYMIIARKDGYIQENYPAIAVQSGVSISDVTIVLPHLITVKGTVTDGKNNGIAGVNVNFGGQNSRMSSYQVYTDQAGYFSERLQVTGTGKETITLAITGLPHNPEGQFELTQQVDLLTKPGEQELDDLRLPINFLPIRVQDVSGHVISDARVILTRMSTDGGQTEEFPGSHLSPVVDQAINLGHGMYEGRHLKSGTYTISVSKEGYETQERTLTITSGEVAPEAVFVLSHYVLVSGFVTNGKGEGVPEAILEFDSQNSTVVDWNFERGDRTASLHQQSNATPQITTDARGYFTSCLLVKKPGVQQVRAVWNERYVKQRFFQLPEQPDMNYTLEEGIRLPINFAPVRATNVLGEGLAGVEITLTKTGRPEEEPIHFFSLGDGFYEANEIPDGVYMMTIHKEGYQEATENISVQGGEQFTEQHFSLPHFVTLRGTVVNGKGIGVAGANVTLTGLNSQLVNPDQTIVTESDGSFQIELLITGPSTSLRTGAGHSDLREHIEVTWVDDTPSSPAIVGDKGQKIPFGISHDFYLPTIPGSKNLELLTLPANFASVTIQDVSGRGLPGVNVTFMDENGKEFKAKEFAGGFYEGQNLPSGIYTVKVSKEGYREDDKTDVWIGENPGKQKAKGQNPESESSDSSPEKVSPETINGVYPERSRKALDRLRQGTPDRPFDLPQNRPLTFQLPHYVYLDGVMVNGKGQKIASGITLELEDSHSNLLPESVVFDQNGNFEAKLLVNAPGREQLHIKYAGEYGRHVRKVSFVLPSIPETVHLQRVTLPVNFIPIEVRDLMGHGLIGAKIMLHHLENGKEIMATELGSGQYEGQNLLDGSYKISVTKEGYKSVENPLVTVTGGVVSDIKSFRLQHYVWISGVATNGEGTGIRDPVIHIERLRSLDIQKQSDITGKFELKLEVREVGNEKMSIEWKNTYRTPLVFKLPERPERKNLGKIRLPVNFLFILVTDISGSTLRDAEVTVEGASRVIQSLKTDQNGSCKTSDLQNGMYKVSVKKPGYKLESREVQVVDGTVIPVKFNLPHYVVIRGEVKDIKQKPVGGVSVIFEEFTDAEGQKLLTSTEAHGRFEQRLLIDDPRFLERQKGHFRIKKGGIEQLFTFKVPAEPDQVLYYKTLLFPAKYLVGKVVDDDTRTIPIPDANISLVLVAEDAAAADRAVREPLTSPLDQAQDRLRTAPLTAGLRTGFEQAVGSSSDETFGSQETLRFVADSLGVFEAGELQEGEYKITIQKEGYLTREDFVRISGLLQEREFTLQKE